jgi:predicted ATPase/class 3 adenylate cyclase
MAPVKSDLPSGTVTFLFSDVEGATRLLDELGADGYSRALAEHRRLIRAACARFGGIEVDTQGDAFFYAFPTAPGAVEAAQAIGEGLASGPIRVRIGLHTGTPLLTDEGYVGSDVHRAARIAAAGHGGQVLASASTAALVDLELRDLGEHRFKDLAAPERVFQVDGGDHPALRSLRNVWLPVPATPFLGREPELEKVSEFLARDEIRLLTLTGPGGTGKTRLALQAAAEASDHYPDGIWWVPLAPLRDSSLLHSAVAQALEVQEQPGRELEETLTAELAGKRALILLDNAEHLLPGVAVEIAPLAANGPTLLVTSRERLQLQGEQLYPVPTLAEQDGIDLFLARARALEPAFETNDLVRELCSRLDNLPLALELAAARTLLFSPAQLLERLSQRLDLLKGGRDADPRQQTLRATIEWSYELLTPDEQRLLRCLSVFSGGCTYDAAEEVCGADPDTLQSLLDKSLLRRRESRFGSRYWMLETIREYAAQRLEDARDASTLRRRQAEWCCELAERLIPLPRHLAALGADTEAGFARLEDERDNVHNALAWAWSSGEDELGLRLGVACSRWWIEGADFYDAVAWLEVAAPRIPLVPPGIQLQALKVAGLTAFHVLADTEQADQYWTRAQAIAAQLRDTEEIGWLEGRRAAVVWERGDLDVALAQARQGLKGSRARGNRFLEAQWLHGLGEVLRDLQQFDEAERALLEADVIYRDLGGQESSIAANTHSLGDLALDRGDLTTAADFYRQSLAELPGRSPATLVACLAGLASVLAEGEHDETAATTWGAVCVAEELLGFRMIATERRRYEGRLARLEGTPAWAAGKDLTLEQALALASAAMRE